VCRHDAVAQKKRPLRRTSRRKKKRVFAGLRPPTAKERRKKNPNGQSNYKAYLSLGLIIFYKYDTRSGADLRLIARAYLTGRASRAHRRSNASAASSSVSKMRYPCAPPRLKSASRPLYPALSSKSLQTNNQPD
jgi:hypothetical protein